MEKAIVETTPLSFLRTMAVHSLQVFKIKETVKSRNHLSPEGIWHLWRSRSISLVKYTSLVTTKYIAVWQLLYLN